jgi:uncharacterized membrane protein YedE/YeeE
MVMSAPLVLSENMNLVMALVLGVFFGFFLERGGLGNPHRLTGVFYLTDFAVPKAMFTAILVAATGLCLLSDLKLLDMSRVWIIPTFFWPQLAGGALFGLGFLVSGYCPGTAMAGFASGRLDALVTMVGVGIGTLLFAALYPWIEPFYTTGDMGQITLPELTGMNHWVVVSLLFGLAGAMFSLMEWNERRKGRPRAGKPVELSALSSPHAAPRGSI